MSSGQFICVVYNNNSNNILIIIIMILLCVEKKKKVEIKYVSGKNILLPKYEIS